MLTETLKIEETPVNVSDPKALENMLNDVTRIKLKGLRQLIYKDLRGGPGLSDLLNPMLRVNWKNSGKDRPRQRQVKRYGGRNQYVFRR
ncbi:MAG: hypothetical protein M2R45_03605 [Verrucomicrobia subdivision 3 bacterium]|nr:hypothetical protein [Limisphaerales bacterium]MCS1416900.1 hypothetical protein [Limisphaerales bacterium]